MAWTYNNKTDKLSYLCQKVEKVTYSINSSLYEMVTFWLVRFDCMCSNIASCHVGGWWGRGEGGGGGEGEGRELQWPQG